MKRKKHIRFVSLEADRFFKDPDFIRWSAEQRGIFLTTILLIYSNDGSLKITPDMHLIHNCSRKKYDSIWTSIKCKFVQNRCRLMHHKCTKELKIAKERSQVLTDRAIKANHVRWSNNSIRSPNENETKRERNEIENENVNNSNSNRNNVLSTNDVYANYKRSHSNSSSTNSLVRSSNSARPSTEAVHKEVSIKNIEIARLQFLDRLNHILRASTRSDRTGFNNICDFLAEGCRSGRFNIEIFDRAIGYAKEARNGQNPNALFMSLMRKELGYRKKP